MTVSAAPVSAAGTSPRQLRDYQAEAVTEVNAEWDDGIRQTSVIIPTGGGKSTVLGKLAVDERAAGGRAVILAHRRELLDAIAETVVELDPTGEKPGIVMGANNEPGTDIVCASFQTLARSPKKFAQVIGGGRSLVLVDECHHALASSYLRVLADFGLDVDPDMTITQMRELSSIDVERTGQRVSGTRACGFTATMARGDGGKLGAVWQSVAFERDLQWGISSGYLIRPRGLTVVTPELNVLAQIKTVAGDFNQHDLDEVMRASIPTTVDAVMRHVSDRCCILFAVSVEQGEELAAALTAAGMPTEAVSGSHSKAEREAIYTRFRTGVIQSMVTVQVLTEGADFPRCDTVVMARPTRSDVLFTQMVGRAVRLYADPVTGVKKTDAIVMDLTGILRDKKIRTLNQLLPDVEEQVFDTEGEELVAVEASLGGDGAKLSDDPEREGRVDLEEVELFVEGMPDVAVATSPAGVTFLPATGPDDRSQWARPECYFLWPPAPEEADQVFVGHLSSSGQLGVFRDGEGRVVSGTFDEAIVGAATLAENTDCFSKRSARWRRLSTRPSQTQRDKAQRMGVTIPRGASKVTASDMLVGTILDGAISGRLPWFLRQLNT